MDEKTIEKLATAISGAFLAPMEDMYRELGPKRTKVTADMQMVAKEYGVSMMMLAKRAQLIGIITDNVYQNYMAKASQCGWRINEPSGIPAEESKLFMQLTIRAIAEDDISVQRGAELLQISFEKMNDSIQLQEA